MIRGKPERNLALYQDWLRLGSVNEMQIYAHKHLPNPSWLQKESTYPALAEKYGLSQARVRQIILWVIVRKRWAVNVRDNIGKLRIVHTY